MKQIISIKARKVQKELAHAENHADVGRTNFIHM